MPVLPVMFVARAFAKEGRDGPHPFAMALFLATYDELTAIHFLHIVNFPRDEAYSILAILRYSRYRVGV